MGTDLVIKKNDAAFVYLAEKIGGALVTDNPKHQKGARKARIFALKDYK